jgi:hypothetical protein
MATIIAKTKNDDVWVQKGIPNSYGKFMFVHNRKYHFTPGYNMTFAPRDIRFGSNVILA